ncbi:MAG: hypothetical protein ACI9CD_000825 [Candidatus Deianiraeaceae bacterium]
MSKNCNKLKNIQPYFKYYNPYMGAGNELLEDEHGGIGGLIGKHKKYDVSPYYLHGNVPNDNTTNGQRLRRNLEKFNN